MGWLRLVYHRERGNNGLSRPPVKLNCCCKLMPHKRDDELKELDAAAKAGGLLAGFGRRRVGKTRLLTRSLNLSSKA